MNKTRVQEHLAAADRHRETGKMQIRKQAVRVKKLATNAEATKNAKETLREFRELQGSMERHRKLIREEASQMWED
jgi:hypothetical protein